jgi:peptidylprolyl isomerase
VGNPAEETFCHPDAQLDAKRRAAVKPWLFVNLRTGHPSREGDSGFTPVRRSALFERDWNPKLPFPRMPDGDVYAPQAGFSGGFPVARDPKTGKAWLIHAYGMVGSGRDDAPNTGGGTELFVVIGQAPRDLDRNDTLLGRVVQGMDLLSTLTRGPAPMGFYEDPALRTPILRVRVAADVPLAERTQLEVLGTDTPLFGKLIESRRNRREPWFHRPAGRIDVCNIPIPVRKITAASNS